MISALILDHHDSCGVWMRSWVCQTVELGQLQELKYNVQRKNLKVGTQIMYVVDWLSIRNLAMDTYSYTKSKHETHKKRKQTHRGRPQLWSKIPGDFFIF